MSASIPLTGSPPARRLKQLFLERENRARGKIRFEGGGEERHQKDDGAAAAEHDKWERTRNALSLFVLGMRKSGEEEGATD